MQKIWWAAPLARANVESVGLIETSGSVVGETMNPRYKAKRLVLWGRSYSLAAHQAGRFINSGILGNAGVQEERS